MTGGAAHRAVATIRVALWRTGPERETALLLVKAALATVLAWQFSEAVLDSPTPFYAPLAALLVVDRTVAASMLASVQRIAAVVVGMGVAWLVGATLGVHWWSMGPVILVALVIGRWSRLGDHGLQVPSMVLLSLLTVGGTDTAFTLSTILETLVGGAIGVATNVIVLPPLLLKEPRAGVTAITRRAAELLHGMADGLRGGAGASVDIAREWYLTSHALLEAAPEVIERVATGRESGRFNPVRTAQGLDVDWTGHERAVEAMRRTLWQISSVARTLMEASGDADDLPAPSPRFLSQYADVLTEVGTAIGSFGKPGQRERDAFDRALSLASTRLGELSDALHETSLDDSRAWPAYGSLLLDAHRMVRELRQGADDAAVPTESGPIRRPALPGLPRNDVDERGSDEREGERPSSAPTR